MGSDFFSAVVDKPSKVEQEPKPAKKKSEPKEEPQRVPSSESEMELPATSNINLNSRIEPKQPQTRPAEPIKRQDSGEEDQFNRLPK